MKYIIFFFCIAYINCTGQVCNDLRFPEQLPLNSQMSPTNEMVLDEINEENQLYTLNYYARLQANIWGAQGNWISRGPTNTNCYGSFKGIGRVFPLKVNKNDSNEIYAGTPTGGLWKTNDGGNTWTSLTDTIAGSGATVIEIDPTNSNVVYFSSNNKLYKSNDAGLTWTLLPLANVNKLLIDDQNSQNLIASANGLYKSANGGNNWVQLNGGGYSDVIYKPGNPNVLYAIKYGRNIYRSTNGGLSFDSIANMGFGSNFNAIAVTIADSNYVYVLAAGGYGEVAKSIDGGNTFALMPPSTNIYYGVPTPNFAVSSVDKNFLVVGGNIVSISSDGGLTWSVASRYYYDSGINLPYVHPDTRSISFSGNSFWCGTDGGIYQSSDAGITFIDKTPGLSVAQFSSLACSESDTSVFLCGAADNSTIIHTDSGWANTFTGDGVEVAINPDDPLIIYGKSQYGYQRSFNGGITEDTNPFFVGLNEGTYSFSPMFPLKFNHQNPNSLFLLVNNVWKSTSRGDSIQKISNLTTGAGGGGFLYVCNTDSNIIMTAKYKTIDGGITWQPFTKKVNAVDPDEPGKIWAFDNSSGLNEILFSNDTGNTWAPIPSYDLNFGTGCYLRCANNSEDGIFFIQHNNIYYLDNTLSNWQPFNNGLPNVIVSDMNVLTAANKIRVATFGRGVWESDLFNYSLPLVADFVFDKDTIIQGDSIHFFDNSLNNGSGYNPAYTWLFPGGTPSSSSLSNPYVTYNSAGIYDVALKIINNNGVDSVIKNSIIHVLLPVGILPNEEENNFQIFPNPLIDNFQLKWSSKIENEGKLSVANSLGQVVYSERIIPNVIITINPKWDAGIYLLKLSTKHGFHTKKIIIIK